MKRLGKVSVVLSFLVTSFGTIVCASASEQLGQPENSSNVLVIHSYNSDFFWTKEIKAGIEQGFQKSAHKTTVFHEFLDAKRYPNLHHKDSFLEGIREKYEHTDLDLLMVADDPGLNLVLQVKEEYFAELPVVFMGINHVQERFLNKPWLTGVFETHSVIETILEAQRQTGSNNLILIADSSDTGEANQKRLQSSEIFKEGAESFHFVKDITPAEIESRVGSYPDHWPIFIGGQLRKDHANGPLISFDQGAEMLHASVPNPIYTETRALVGIGTVGGKVLDGNYHAQQAVQLAERLLSGASPKQVKPILKAKNQWMFDAQALEKTDISLNDLPPGSILINRRLSFYQYNPELVWSAIVLLGLSLVTIAILSNAIRRQKSAESKLKANEKQLEKKVQERTVELREALNALQKSQSETEERSLELAKNNGELEIARLCADKANQAKSDFLAKMSHELRTPLNSILGYTQLLQRDQKLLVQHESYLNTISSSGSHLLNLINNILDLTKVEAGKSQLNQKDFNIEALLESVCQMLEPEANKKGIRLSCKCEPGFPEYIFQDESKCKQIIINILGNAVKFTSYGQVSLNAEILSFNQLKLVISDTGPGISPQDLKQLFNPFCQAKGEEYHGRGTGLGLSISEEFIKLMGGTIDVESELGKGSVFTILMPFETARRQVRNDSCPQSKLAYKISMQKDKQRILIVDDDKPSRKLFCEFLNISGFELKTAVNGEEAIALSREWHPHAILMDVQMPVVNGLEATQIIKREVMPQPVIIVLTTSTQPKAKADAIAAGCDSFLNKPCSIEDLFQTLAKQLKLEIVAENSAEDPASPGRPSRLPPETPDGVEMPVELSNSLETLSQAWLQRLARAAASLSETKLDNVLDDLPAGNARLTAHISQLKTNFRYDLIVEMVEPYLQS